jgi:4-amino-4-deoxy-L-arabinose transferase-like glycosyltransferase
MLARPRGGLPTVSWRQAAWQFARRFSPLNFAWCAWRMRPLLGLAVVALVAGPWFLAVHLRTEGAFLHEFIWKHHVERFIEPLDNHQGPWWYYAPAMLAGFFPWSVFAIPALIEAVRTLRRGGRRGRAMLLLACWAAVYVVFFSKASTKLPNYVLPAYPALALAVGWFIDRWLRRPRRIGVWWPRASFGILALVGVAMIALPAAARLGGENGVSVFEQLGIAPGFEQPLQLVGWLGVVLVVGGLACLVCDLLALRRLATTVMAVSSLAFVIAALGGVALSVDRLQTSEALARAIRESGSAKPRVAEFGYFRPSLAYYTRGRLESCASPEDAAHFLAQSSDSFLVTPRAEYERLQPLLPADAFVLQRVPQFPKRGEIVLLARGAK